MLLGLRSGLGSRCKVNSTIASRCVISSVPAVDGDDIEPAKVALAGLYSLSQPQCITGWRFL